MEYKVLDLFCGAGGLSYGFKMAGFDVVGGIDHEKNAVNTHELNFPGSYNYCGDIREFDNDMIKENFGSGVDVIIGGPPCQGFSSANMWQKDEMDDERNKLFFEFIRFVEQLKPKAFLIENVRGILTKDDGYAKKKIYELMENIGYKVSSSVLLGSDYGVPQKRVRAFFVGIRNDLNKEFDFSKLVKKTQVTVKEAISDLYELEDSVKNEDHEVIISKKEKLSDYQKLMRTEKGEIFNHIVRYPNEKVVGRMKFVPQGGNWRNVPEELWDTIRNNRHSSAYRRLDEKAVSVTIDTGHMNYFHPKYHRVPTVRESARIQSFPDSFVFTGSKGAQFKQVGNAVPPLLGKAIAVELMKILDEVK